MLKYKPMLWQHFSPLMHSVRSPQSSIIFFPDRCNLAHRNCAVFICLMERFSASLVANSWPSKVYLPITPTAILEHRKILITPSDVLAACSTDTIQANCWPVPEVADNMDTLFMGNLGLTQGEVNDIVASEYTN